MRDKIQPIFCLHSLAVPQRRIITYGLIPEKVEERS